MKHQPSLLLYLILSNVIEYSSFNIHGLPDLFPILGYGMTDLWCCLLAAVRNLLTDIYNKTKTVEVTSMTRSMSQIKKRATEYRFLVVQPCQRNLFHTLP